MTRSVSLMPMSTARACLRHPVSSPRPARPRSVRSGFGWIRRRAMPPRFRALAVALAVGASGLPACVPPAADYTESEWNKNLRLDPAPAQLTARFAPGASRILPGDLARLRATVVSAGIVPSDRVVVAVAGPPSLAAARFETVAASLLQYSIVASPAPLSPAPPDAVVIRRERYVVT